MSAPMKIEQAWLVVAEEAFAAAKGLQPLTRLACALSAVAPLIRADALQEAAKVIDPKDARPCECMGCDCMNIGNAEHVAQWDEATANTAAIRALATTGGRPMADRPANDDAEGPQAVDLANQLQAVLAKQPTAVCYLALGMVLGHAASVEERPNFSGFFEVLRKVAKWEFDRALKGMN